MRKKLNPEEPTLKKAKKAAAINYHREEFSCKHQELKMENQLAH